MEFFFLALLIVLLAVSLGSGFPVAFAIPGSAIVAVGLAALSGLIVSGNPDAFFTHGGGPGEWLFAGAMNIRGIYNNVGTDVLIAVPLFIFMGLMLEKSRVAEDLLVAMARLFGTLRGGLGISVVLVGALLAATTSVIGATVIAMGMISLPTMLRNRYSKPMATGIVAATGTLGQIVPPSIVLLILVHQLTTAVNEANAARRALYKTVTGELLMPSQFDVPSVSAGEMFMGAMVPSLVLVALYVLYILAAAHLRPDLAPVHQRTETTSKNAVAALFVALAPPMTLILLVLGSIIAGVTTVNQAGAVGAAGATMMAGYRLREGQRGAFWPTLIAIVALVALGVINAVFHVNLRKIEGTADIIGIGLAAFASSALAVALGWSLWRTWATGDTLKRVLEDTTKTTSLVFAILIGAVMLTAAFRGFGGEDMVRDFMRGLSGGFWGQFAVAMAIIFVLGFFLDFLEITVVVVPIIAPILLTDPAANVTAVWFGVMIALNIQTSFLTPPFGFALFYLRGVAPKEVRTLDIYKGVIPFIAVQLLVLGVVAAFPTLVTYLPTRILLGAEASPPPTNPRLQYCIEEFVDDEFRANRVAIRRAIGRARKIDLAVLPPPLRAELTRSFEQAENAFPAMEEITRTAEMISEAAPTYRPVHDKVRRIERDIRRIDKMIEKNRTIISWASGSASPEDGIRAEERIKTLTNERAQLMAQIPSGWKGLRSDMAAKLKAHHDARNRYRQTVDAAYNPVAEVIQVIKDRDQLGALEEALRTLSAELNVMSLGGLTDRLKAIYSQAAVIRRSEEVRNALTQARRTLHADQADRAAIADKIQGALVVVAKERAWRVKAAQKILGDLEVFEAAIADTIGIRGRSRLSDRVASEISNCVATPRDINLNF
ncbi:TRAP transporter large permease subunit [Pacificispira sp.]|uniref:TRAP transporter large permease n=1 Tax=Pacificispira sp. TaxID=2888761 RepID=UPI003BA9DB25